MKYSQMPFFIQPQYIFHFPSYTYSRIELNENDKMLISV